ncbi:MAG: TetR/AcrR family transcriptional regulator [Acidimicrobiales bacterium]
MREHILSAAYAGVARQGLARTTVEEVARQAGVSRATVYRYFPGGRTQLQRDVVAWEAARFLERLAAATEGAGDLEHLLAAALVFGHQALADHEVLQTMLATEPAALLTQLGLGGGALVAFIRTWLRPHLAPEALAPGVSLDAAEEYLARMLLSLLGAHGQWDLSDPAQVATLVRTQFVAGVLAPVGH